MLPSDVSIYVMMHMQQHPTFESLKKFVKDYVRVVAHQEAIKGQKPLFQVDNAMPRPGQGCEVPTSEGEESDEELMAQEDAEILAFMKSRGIKVHESRPGRFNKGRSFHRGGGAGAARPPPRGRADLSCVNCGRK